MAESHSLPIGSEAAVRHAIARDIPNREISSIRVCHATPSELIVRVYLPVPKLTPTPYVIYRIELPGLVAARLSGNEAAPYQIANYK
jgi:hypothetical protein